ncbi:MAG: amidase [Rhodothermales bacterium]|nr:amidase [Rhodothermales bacterium]
MKRRTFLRGTTLAATGSALPFVKGLSTLVNGESVDRRTASEFALDEATFADLQKQMESGERSSRELCELYLERIADLDNGGPSLHSVIEVNPDALDIAEKLDRERDAATLRGPLHGIPIILKDNINTADRMSTSAGSLALKDSRVEADAFLVSRLRASGAVILAKSNLSEWANFRSTRSSSGWSARGGQVRNPYVLDRSPCGSSSGSAVVVAANMCAAAVGTETDGSIVCPSSANGIVGIKPTVGLVSRSGIIPIAHSQDTAGPMARTVTDAAILLGAMTGIDQEDGATAEQKAYRDYTQFLDEAGLEGARIGVARNFLGFHEGVDRLIDDVIEVLTSQGATVVDPADITTKGEYGDSEYEVLLYEFKAGLNRYLAGLGPDAPVRTLSDLIDFNRDHREEEMPFFEQEIFEAAQKKGDLTSPEYLEALAKNHRLTREEGIDATIRKHDLDAIMAASGGPAWTIDVVTGDRFLGGSSSPAAVSGYPNITVPAGQIHGLPVGVSFFGRAFSEPRLLRIAYAYEQASRKRIPPQFRASIL